MNRQQWSKLATEKTSEIVGGEVEVVLMKDTISIYSEDKSAADDAVKHWEGAGSEVVGISYYEADEDMPEAWTIEMTLS